jgi:20S proteasome alpha/beta subunit
MTLTVGIIAKDGIILASDSRLSDILYSNDDVDKIIEISDRVAVGFAGDGRLANHIFDLIKRSNSVNFSHSNGIQNIAEELCKELADRFDKYYPNIPHRERDPLEILLVGYSLEPECIPHIYELSSVDNFIPRQSPAGHSSIGIPHISNYLLNRIYEKDKMYADEAAKLSILCINETKSQYRNVGGEIKVAVLSNTQKFSILPKHKTTALEKECNESQNYQKYKFYPEKDKLI